MAGGRNHHLMAVVMSFLDFPAEIHPHNIMDTVKNIYTWNTHTLSHLLGGWRCQINRNGDQKDGSGTNRRTQLHTHRKERRRGGVSCGLALLKELPVIHDLYFVIHSSTLQYRWSLRPLTTSPAVGVVVVVFDGKVAEEYGGGRTRKGRLRLRCLQKWWRLEEDS